MSGKTSEAPSRLIIDSIVFCTSTVSGTFSSSTSVTPGMALMTAAPSACA
jgi:hypothetical protein